MKTGLDREAEIWNVEHHKSFIIAGFAVCLLLAAIAAILLLLLGCEVPSDPVSRDVPCEELPPPPPQIKESSQ